MIIIDCKYGMKTVYGLKVNSIEEARKLRDYFRSQLNGEFDRWYFIAKDESGKKVLGSNN